MTTLVRSGDERSASPTPSLTLGRVGWLASVALFGVLPVLTMLVLFADAIEGDSVAFDFGQFYGAAHAIVHGLDPYVPDPRIHIEWGGPYPYPPLPGLLAIPLTLVSLETARFLVMCALVGAALGVLYVLGVRDWRCYGLALLWPPVISAIQTGNLTLWFALGAAVVWRSRDRLAPSSGTVATMLAAKFFLWPLAAWLAATRRVAGAALACVLGAAFLAVSWAAIGFAGFVDYPSLLRRLEDAVGEDSYTAYVVGLDIGLPSPVARAVWLALGLALLACVVLLGRRGDDRSAFVVAIAASLALTPIVWLHYFALLLVAVAVARPRLGLVWFIPLGMVLTPGNGHPTPFQTAWTLLVAALTIALALRVSRRPVVVPEPALGLP